MSHRIFWSNPTAHMTITAPKEHLAHLTKLHIALNHRTVLNFHFPEFQNLMLKRSVFMNILSGVSVAPVLMKSNGEGYSILGLALIRLY